MSKKHNIFDGNIPPCYIITLKNNFLDFDNAEIVFECNNVAGRHIVDSALICHYSKQDRSINLSNGFLPQN